MNVAVGYSGNVVNKPLTDPSVVLKLSMMTFLAVQAIRQLVLVNNQFKNGKETDAGRTAAYFTVTLTLLIAGVLATSPLNLKSGMVAGVTFAVVAGVLGSGIAMLYDYFTDKTVKPESNRIWFAVAHIIFGLILLAFLLYSLTK